jgi:hypothetical protein
MVFSSRAARVQSSVPALFEEAARQMHDLLGADTAVILDLRSFHAPLPPTAPTPTGPINTFSSASSECSSSRRPHFPRTPSGFTSSSAEWYSSTASGRALRAGGQGGLGTISILQCAGAEWADRMAGAGAAVSHALVAYYNVRLPLFSCRGSAVTRGF